MKPLPQIADFPIPYCREAELALIAEIVQTPENYPVMAGQIMPEFFFNEINKQIWLTIVGMANNHESIRLETIMPKVDREYFIHEVMGAETRGTALTIQGLIKALRDTYIKREIYYLSINALTKIDNGCDAMLVQSMLDGFSENIAKGMNDGQFENTIQIGNAFATDIENNVSTKIPTKMPKLDWYTMGGFTPGELIILAARPGVGKTTIALQWALNMSRAGEKTLFFSLEMTKKELFKRLMLSTGLITPAQMAGGGVDWRAYESAMSVVANENFMINDKSNTLEDICSKISTACMEKRCNIAFIDYLGLIRIVGLKGMTQAQVIGVATQRLKNLAKDNGIPIVLLCQMNRDSVKDGRAPQLTDLRDSGNIEQDADKVIMMEDGSEVEGDNKIKMWIRKCRNGKKTKDNPIMLQGNEYYTNFIEI